MNENIHIWYFLECDMSYELSDKQLTGRRQTIFYLFPLIENIVNYGKEKKYLWLAFDFMYQGTIIDKVQGYYYKVIQLIQWQQVNQWRLFTNEFDRMSGTLSSYAAQNTTFIQNCIEKIVFKRTGF